MSLRLVPRTPRVISPSPTPSDRSGSLDPEQAGSESSIPCFGPVARSVTRMRSTTPQLRDDAPSEDRHHHQHPELRRARTRSRSPIDARTAAAPNPVQHMATVREQQHEELSEAAGRLLVPPPPTTPGYWTWPDLSSRSPSPLSLIPIHRQWRKFVHKHEVPRKALHVSIGFLAMWLYGSGTQPLQVTPWLMAALVPIVTVDYLRLHWTGFNRVYVRALGAFMRETEFSGYNGVIFYLLGAWAVLAFFPKDVGMTAVLLLSWCDTAASTFGRLWGRHTPRIRRGKSLAGSLAALLTGIATSVMFWGWLAPAGGSEAAEAADPASALMFRGVLRLPAVVCEAAGWSRDAATITGGVALGVLGVWSGLVASASEVVDLWGLDDNLTIPVLSGIGMWAFLKVFG